MTQRRPFVVVLRVCMGVVGGAALAFGALWAYEVLQVFEPDFNPKGVAPGDRRNLAILGFFGVASSLLAAGSAIAYAKTAVADWIAGAAVGGIYGSGLFVVWIDFWEHAGGVG